MLALPQSKTDSIGEQTQRPKATEGVIDLRKWSFKTDGIIDLDGDWSFHPHKLLPPEEANAKRAQSFVPVPRSWNSYPESLGFEGGQGYATYKLTVLVTPSDQRLTIRVPNIFSAYKLWVNGKVLACAGVVGTNRESSSAEQYPRLVSFDATQERVDLVIQVSNFQHRKGGIWVGFTLGETKEIVNDQIKVTVQETVIFGSLFIIGLYHIGLYAFRRQERFTLYFGLLCLLVAARTSVTGDSYAMQLFPFVTWEIGMKVEYVTFALSAVAGYMYIYGLFPKDASVRVKKAVISIGALSCLPILLLPALHFTKLLPVLQLFVLSVGLYALYVLIMAQRHRREGAVFVLTGMAVFVLTVMNDMLFYNEWFASTQLVPLGLFFFIIMQSFIISSRFSNALRRVEQVSSELRELNVHLEERIEERTEALRAANVTLEMTNRELARLEKSRRHLMTNISHDLRTPITLLQGYLEAMQDGVVKTQEQQQKYVRMMLGKVTGLNRLIRDLFELTKLEAGQLRFNYTEVLLLDWMERLKEHFELDVRSQDLTFQCYPHPSATTEEGGLPPEQIILQIDQQRMDRVMANIIYNAIKYTPEGGGITLTFQYEPERKRVVVRVRDTGNGIAPEHLPFIFDRFYKKDMARNSAGGGSGLGLAIAKEIVEAHDGMIGVESEPGEGTTIWFTLPASALITRLDG